MHTLKTHLARTWFGAALSLVLATTARAAEPLHASAELKPHEAAAGVPLVLGAPPAWVIMAVGVAVVSITVLRRRKTATERVRR